mgnify:CR=1 FL=1
MPEIEKALPKPIRYRSGCKVGWNTYATREEAEIASAHYKEKGAESSALGYDFGYQCPGEIRPVKWTEITEDREAKSGIEGWPRKMFKAETAVTSAHFPITLESGGIDYEGGPEMWKVCEEPYYFENFTVLGLVEKEGFEVTTP